MATSENSYGSVESVAGLAPRWANTSGVFDLSTRPTLPQLERIIDQIGGLLNAMLANAGFQIPVSQADAKLALDFFADEEAAAIVEGINGSGRFGPSTKAGGGKGRFALLVEDAEAFINAHKVGFERLGATRTYSATSGLAFRDTDESGNDTFPIFQRKAFGETFTDWDTD